MSFRATMIAIAARLLDAVSPTPVSAVPGGRVGVVPPARAHRDSSFRARLRRWFNVGWEPTSPHAHWKADNSERSRAILLAVRRDFIGVLSDVRTQRAYLLLERIRAARSLHELWHFRPEVFDLLARFHAQSEADRRLALLNRHFPTRAARSGFGLLSNNESDR